VAGQTTPCTGARLADVPFAPLNYFVILQVCNFVITATPADCPAGKTSTQAPPNFGSYSDAGLEVLGMLSTCPSKPGAATFLYSIKICWN
jgi:hypothetical protein